MEAVLTRPCWQSTVLTDLNTSSGQLVQMRVIAVLQLMASLVVEVVLACKEVNQKTRSAANDVLVDIAHAMHESAPPSLDPSASHTTCKHVQLQAPNSAAVPCCRDVGGVPTMCCHAMGPW